MFLNLLREKLEEEGFKTNLKPPKLYFKELFEREERRVKEHIFSLQKNRNIKLDDYTIYSKIENKYCDPNLLKNLGKSNDELPWIVDKSLGFWADKIVTTSKEIKGVMEDYNS